MEAHDLAIIRDEVGATPPDAEVEVIFERVGTVGGTIYSIVSRKLADLLNDPASFNVAGEYSQDVRENIQALERKLQKWSGFAPDELGVAAGGPTRIVTPSRRRGR